MPENDLYLRLAAALAVGLLVGMERGWKTRGAEDHGRAAGLRTFGLSGLMGGISGALGETFGAPIVAAAFLSFAAALGAFTWLEAKSTGDISATTVVAGLVTFLLGIMAVVGDISVTVGMAVSMTVLLALRTQLHTWLFNLTWPEIRAVLVLLVMAFLLLPLLPDHTIDPLATVNPREIWILAISMTAVSFTGYVAVRVFGGTWGILLTAAAGGISSSTATTLAFAKMGQGRPELANLLGGGILVSGTVMMFRIWALAAILNPALFMPLAPLAGGALVLLGAAAFLFAADRRVGTAREQAMIVIRNPLELWTSLKLAAFIALVMMAVKAIQTIYGGAGLLVLSGLSGVADVDAITVSLARTESAGTLAATAILLATSVNTLAKAAITAWIGGVAVGLRVGLTSLAAICVIATAFSFAP